MFKNYSKRKILNQYNTIVEKQQELYFLQNVTILVFFFNITWCNKLWNKNLRNGMHARWILVLHPWISHITI